MQTRTIIVISVCIAVIFVANSILSKPRVIQTGPDTGNIKSVIDAVRSIW